MSTIDDKLAMFLPVTLEELDSVKLLDRIDTKYIFHEEKLPCILEMLHSDYRILEINNIRNSRYETNYLDTPDHVMYSMHLNGKLSRYKVRYRTYLDSGISFLETKCKTNKGRTIKKRMVMSSGTGVPKASASAFICKHTPFEYESLSPVVCIQYFRMTLVNCNFTERLTIDTGLKFCSSGKDYTLPGLTIAEIKQGTLSGSLFSRIMHSFHISPYPISKYCTGITLLADGIKKNNYKRKILRVRRILQTNIAP